MQQENPHQCQKNQNLRLQRQKKVFDWAGSWIWEIGGAALSIVCIALLIGFLAYVNRKPYPNWQYQASPNTVVSIIVTVAKAAMLAPVSSCLSQLKWTQYQTPTPLYHIHVLDEASRGPWGAFQLLWVFTPSLATVGAVLAILALAIDPFAQQILSYPSHHVLPANETASVQRAQEYIPGIRADDPATGGLPAPLQIAILNRISEARTPSSQLALQYVTENWEYGRRGDALVLDRREWTCVTKLRNEEIFGIKNAIASLLEVDYAHNTIYTLENATKFEEKPKITQCGVFFCEKQYTDNYFSLHHHQVQPSRSQPLFVKNDSMEPSTIRLFLPPGTKTLSENSTYITDGNTFGLLNSQLTRLLNTTSPFASDMSTNYEMFIILSNFKNINETLTSLTTSLTDVIRASPYSIQVLGQAFRTTTFISVRWPWIIFPTAAVLLSTVLLMVTAITSRRLHTVGWKSCVLELLVGRLETRPEHALGPLRNVDEMQRMSKKIKVTMRDDGGTVSFVEH
ncbi:hypothetical protein PHISCL_09399 [Aspergillus sclerotialis]|uniref:Uncharacterized protein n=1 Tax=Aspergillus sclerotialis TaxID=2070753 RepID=A0A3A2Z7U4_9EURO|nr:hypothetical protein PHISCL_09399 [Aspergillus sclerotialis]